MRPQPGRLKRGEHSGGAAYGFNGWRPRFLALPAFRITQRWRRLDHPTGACTFTLLATYNRPRSVDDIGGHVQSHLVQEVTAPYVADCRW